VSQEENSSGQGSSPTENAAETETKDMSFAREDELIKVSANDIIPGLALPSDVYIRLPTGRFVMVAKKGAKSSIHDLHAAESNKEVSFYVRKSEFLHCVDQNIKIAGILSRKTDIPVERRTEFLKIAVDSVFKEIEFLGFQAKALDQARITINSVMSIIHSKEDYVRLLHKINELPGSYVKDALAVSALAVLIGRKMGWGQAGSLEKLALGGMLRDVGLKEISQEILDKPRKDMTADERITWETHPYRGAEILRTIPGVPFEVIAMTLEHHENALGVGFPRRVRDYKMNPYSKIVCLADAFVELTIKRDGEPSRSPVDAIHHLEFVMGMPYNKSCMLALKKSLELDDQSLLGTDRRKMAA